MEPHVRTQKMPHQPPSSFLRSATQGIFSFPDTFVHYCFAGYSMSQAPFSWPADVCVLIPAYRAAESLGEQLPRVLQYVPAAQVLVVDDGSHDGTDRVCSRYGVRRESHMVNCGKGAALRTGFAALLEREFDWIITMDADGQHAAADLPVLLKAIRRNPETGVWVGSRDMRPGRMPFARICSNTITSTALSILCRCPVEDSQCGYRAYAARLLRRITIDHNRFEAESEIILKAVYAGHAVRFQPVQTLYCSRQSHISHLLDTLRWIRAVLMVWIRLHRQRSHADSHATSQAADSR